MSLVITRPAGWRRKCRWCEFWVFAQTRAEEFKAMALMWKHHREKKHD